MILTLTDTIQALAAAAVDYPQSLQGQQDHFARVLPDASERAEETLREAFSEHELETLRDLLQGMLDPLG